MPLPNLFFYLSPLTVAPRRYSFIHLVQKYSQDLDSIYFCEVAF